MSNESRRETVIAMLDRTPGRVAELLAGRAPDALRRKPTPDVFSMRENVHHLRDIEVEGYAVRLARLLEAEHPVLPGIDGDLLAIERRYNDRPHDDALEELRKARQACVARLKGLPSEAWERQGELEGVGTVTVERLVEMWCAHDAGHIADLERLRSVLGSAAGS